MLPTIVFILKDLFGDFFLEANRWIYHYFKQIKQNK